MHFWVSSLYGLALLSYPFPIITAFLVFRKLQAPLARNFARLDFSYLLFFVGLISVYFAVEFFPQQALAIEVFSDSLFFLLESSLLYYFAKFIFEIQQKPWEGPQKHITDVFSVAGLILPFLINISIYSGDLRVVVLRFVLNSVYFVIFIVWITFLVVQSCWNLRKINDEWKKKTLKGACFIFFFGVPCFFLDSLWPITQEQWHIVPRGFNFQIFVVLLWNFFFFLRWKNFSAETAPPPEQGGHFDSELFNYLTIREREIAGLVIGGKTNQEICDLLQIKMSTTKNHIYSIFNKTGSSSRKELRRMFVRP